MSKCTFQIPVVGYGIGAKLWRTEDLVMRSTITVVERGLRKLQWDAFQTGSGQSVFSISMEQV